MNTLNSGRQAEQVAAEFLVSKGFKLLASNWRTPRCEIDIVAEKRDVIHFVEVKYREHNGQGYGLEYLLPRKLKQMQFAAEVWVQDHNWSGQYCLSAVEVSGPAFQVTQFLPNLT